MHYVQLSGPLISKTHLYIVFAMEFFDTQDHRPFGALVARLTKIMANECFQVVICGPSGSGKSKAVELAAASKGYAVIEAENHLGSVKAFDSWFHQYLPVRIDRDGSLSPAVLLVTCLETVGTSNVQAALDIAFKKQRVVVVANCIHKQMVKPPAQLIFHNGFSQDAIVKAMSQVPGYIYLPRTGLNVC